MTERNRGTLTGGVNGGLRCRSAAAALSAFLSVFLPLPMSSAPSRRSVASSAASASDDASRSRPSPPPSRPSAVALDSPLLARSFASSSTHGFAGAGGVRGVLHARAPADRLPDRQVDVRAVHICPS